jgi:dephospho-CoA kinase
MSIKIGITGGIGSGKTVISKLLATMGIPVYLSDIESKRITVKNLHIRSELISLLGREIYVNGELNKPLLANYLFSNADHARTINNIIHPQVKIDFRNWAISFSSYPIVAMESAILIESGFANEVDKIIMVYSPLEVRIKRTIERDSTNKEAVMQRIQHQMNDEKKINMADYIIMNDNDAPLIPQVAGIVEKLTQDIH